MKLETASTTKGAGVQPLRGCHWRLYTIRKRAELNGIAVSLIKKQFGPRHVQNRIYIERRRCQVIGGLTLGVEKIVERETDRLQKPLSDWPEFLISIPGNEDADPVFIIPRSQLDARGLQALEHVEKYAEAWW